jgi:curved DNA-binding protein CbpA
MPPTRPTDTERGSLTKHTTEATHKPHERMSVLLWAALALLLPATVGADTHYEVLSVPFDATAATIKKAYYKLARTHHPDKVTDDNPTVRAAAVERFKRIAQAHSTLVDSTLRMEYDAELLRAESDAKQQQQRQKSRHWQQQQQQARAEDQQRQQQLRQQQQKQQQKQEQGQQQPMKKSQRPPPERREAPSSSSFRTHEKRAREQVREVTSVLQLADVLDKRKLLDRMLLLALYDSRDRACEATMRSLKFPFPFADWSQEWHGVWWGDLLLAAAHDVGPSLRAGRPSQILAAYETAVGPAKRSTHGVSMPLCPTIVLQRAGEEIGDSRASVLTTLTEQAFQEWVYSQMRVKLTIRNEAALPVRINWIHGGYVKETIPKLKPRESEVRTVYLGHTLQAERTDRKGEAISENSSLLIFKVLSDSAKMVISDSDCIDLSADCEDWQRRGECRSNREFMRSECPRSCDSCRRSPSAPPTNKAATATAATTRAKVEAQRREVKVEVKAKVQGAAKGGKSNSMPSRPGCTDKHAKCKAWADSGECESNAAYMREQCARSCDYCGEGGRGLQTAGVSATRGWTAKKAATAAAAQQQQQQQQPTGRCVDEYSDCHLWAATGECQSNRKYMTDHCARSCGLCPGAAKEPCEDQQASCPAWAKTGQCESNPSFMDKECRKSCNLCVKGGSVATAAEQACVDTHGDGSDCARWAAGGQCKSNRQWMHDKCRRSCRVCEPCKDMHSSCEGWKADKHCERNRRFMSKACVKSCGWCDDTPAAAAGQAVCHDEDIKCEAWAKLGECQKNKDFMQTECARACKLCKEGAAVTVASTKATAAAAAAAKKGPPKNGAAAAPKGATTTTTKPASREAECLDRDHRCKAWADVGSCETNKSVMSKTCCKSCRKRAEFLACDDASFARADCASFARTAGACETPFMVSVTWSDTCNATSDPPPLSRCLPSVIHLTSPDSFDSRAFACFPVGCLIPVRRRRIAKRVASCVRRSTRPRTSYDERRCSGVWSSGGARFYSFVHGFG